MSRLSRKRKYPLPCEDKNIKKIDQTSGTGTTAVISDRRIFQRAISSAQKHGIKLVPGIENNGEGNCSYESAILNINERDCFGEGLVMSPDYYRCVWNIDIMNKILDKRIPWNPGMTKSEIEEGFKELMESGVYERDFFGDMMMAGIACGTRKLILIFNTHEMSPHDPISVIDPAHYGGLRDSEIPIVLAYDLVHYESLHTVDCHDIDETIKLAKSYIAKPSTYRQDYGFTRKDIKFLVSSTNAEIITRNKDNRKMQALKIEKKNDESKSFKFGGISFKELDNGNMICGICQVECPKLVFHIKDSSMCSEIFSVDEFKAEYSNYRSRKSQEKRRKSDAQEGLKLSKGPHIKIQNYAAKKDENKENRNLQKKAMDEFFAARQTNVKNEEDANLQKNKTAWDKYPNARGKNVKNETPKNPQKRKSSSDENSADNKKNVEDMEGFKFDGFCFKTNDDGKVKCGVCQMECSRLIVHMNKNVGCRLKFNMEKFRIEYSNFRNTQRQRKYDAKHKVEDPKGFRDNMNKRIKKYKEKKKAEDPKAFRDSMNKRIKKHEEKKKARDPVGFRANIAERKMKSNLNVDSQQRLRKFQNRVLYGPIFVCSCCHQKLFEHQVEIYDDKLREIINATDPEIIKECIDEEIEVDLGRDASQNQIKYVYLCKSCLRSLKKGKFPKMCVKNGLYVDDIDDEDLKLTELENNLIARNIIFQKIHKMPKSRWHGTHDRLINVPVSPQDVLNTVENLPRTPAEAGIIPIVPVNLKRKLEYKTTHLTQLIDTTKIFRYLKFLNDLGHPSYKFYDDWNVYEKRCKAEDPFGAKLVFPDPEVEIVELDVYKSVIQNANCCQEENGASTSENNDIEEYEKAQKEEEEYKAKDPIRKFQYDYNGTTCMTNKFPETDSSGPLNFAPAEGKIPSNILKDENWDINSFPNLHPSGQNKMFQDRKAKLTPQQYLSQRLKNKDNRFEQCTPYVFAATGYVEEKQMERNIGISYYRAKINTSKDGSKTCSLDEDAFAVMDNVKGTPRYWGKAKMEMLAKIDNFGPFHWFYTLSCADMRWSENFTTILREKGYKIIWIHNQNENGKNEGVHVQVDFTKNGDIKTYSLEKFLEEECDESLHEFIRTNVFTATRNFLNRVTAFRTEIMLDKSSPMKITYWSDKMEFQGRGAGHIHGVAWCNLEKINEMIRTERKVGIILSNDECDSEEERSNDDDENHLVNAYRSLRENKLLKKNEEKALIDFVDRSVTCTTNPELAAKMIDIKRTKKDGLRIIEIVKACQMHHHTKSCSKRGCKGTCRFRFPKFPMWETILTKGMVDDKDEDQKKERIERQRALLESVMNVLEESDIVDDIMNDYDKNNESIEEYRKNRKERILKILEIANVDPDDYVMALKESSRKGINVILARDIDELYVNNYCPEWLEAWNGNIDTSPVFDFFAVVTYVTEYFTKDESGTSMLLVQASKQIKNLPRRDQLKEMKNKFLTHRQMGISEAFMKILPEMRLKNSNIKTLFLHLGKKDEMQRFLTRGDPRQDYNGQDLIKIEDREGLYYEKPNMLDKYLRRDMSEWEKLCYPQYAKMYDPANIKKREGEEEEDDDFENEDNNNEDQIESGMLDMTKFEKDKLKYGEEVKFHYLITESGALGKALPSLMKLENCCPGEPNGMRKRRHPKALRFYKVKRDLNPARYFLHELMMYKSFGLKEYERWQDDENCIEDYEKYKDSIKKVKEKVMEWMEDVEEARYFVEEAMKNVDNIDTEETGEEMDPEKHQEDLDCELEGIEEDEKFKHLDTDGLKEFDSQNIGNWYRKLDLLDYKDLEEKTCKLDEWQRHVVDNVLKFARDVRKFNAGYGSLPKHENLVVIGGAGAGKSTVIECLAQWCHRILEKAGDDPNSPYILKTATTGAAASIIEGSTLHSTLGFSYESKYVSLSDKKREAMRERLKNLKILIVDEFSMMKSDMLYLMHLRLCEIKQVNQDFGGVKLILFGDLAQLKPVLGSYTFACPSNADFKLAYGDGTSSLWRRFNVINLEKNHRQGKDKEYADLLNRVRVGKHTAEDIELLRTRIRKKGHPDLNKALFITAQVNPAAEYNEKMVNRLPGKLYVSKAVHMQAMSKKFEPMLKTKSGRIGDTMFVNILNLKIGARVMVIHNIDVSDLICNGALGTVQGVEESQNGTVSAVIVKFDNPLVGKESRQRNPSMNRKYPDGVVVKKMEKEYSLPKNAGPISSTARCIQLPLVLCWAVTVHKIQGQTVKSPEKVVIDAKAASKSDPAQVYVMLSRVQELEQLYILEKFPEDCIRVSKAAMQEIERLMSVSVNRNPSQWESENDGKITKICFLNCRSIVNKFHSIKSDRSLQKSDLIILTETWLEQSKSVNEYQLPEFTACFNSVGRGRGIACYFNNKVKHVVDINHVGFSITKLKTEKIDIIGVYRSHNGSVVAIIEELQTLVDTGRTTVLGGDMNICALTQKNNYMTESLKEMGFQQVVKKPTHIDGRSLDHIYILPGRNIRFEWSLEYFAKYYSDHDGLGLTMLESVETEK